MRFFINSVMIAALLALTACIPDMSTLRGGRHSPFTPHPPNMPDLPDGDDAYSVGFRAGCNSALGAVGQGLLMTHEFEYNPNAGIESKDYYSGYKEGETFCVNFTDYDFF